MSAVEFTKEQEKRLREKNPLAEEIIASNKAAVQNSKDKARRRSYYARHNAQDPNPDKFSARYWSHKTKW